MMMSCSLSHGRLARKHTMGLGISLGLVLARMLMMNPVAAGAADVEAGMPIYMPPPNQSPRERPPATNRGHPTSQTLVLSALAPQHPGLTGSDQPALYWFLSKDVTVPVEFTLIDESGASPLLETMLASPMRAGHQSLRLSDYKLRLKPGVTYEWSVSVVFDPKHRSRDALAQGFILHVAPSDELTRKLVQEGQQQTASIYASAGYWYDAVSTLSERIEADPNQALYRRQRAALMEQIGLHEAASYDREGGRHDH